MSDVPTFGWTKYTWQKPARRCRLCPRKVRRGIINIHDKGREFHPDFRVICLTCYDSLDDRGRWGGDAA